MSPSCSGLRLSPGFCLLAAWFVLANGWRPLAVIAAAAAIHEAGHCLALRLLGVRITGLRVGVFGGALEADTGRLSYGGELMAVLAGPLCNLLAALALSSRGEGMAFIGANLVLGAFNLLPIRPLDGGRALYLLAAWLAGPSAGEQAARWAGVLAAVLLATVLIFLMERTGGSLWLLPPAAGALAAAARELRGQSGPFLLHRWNKTASFSD